MSAESAWHPAFMPNSATDIIHKVETIHHPSSPPAEPIEDPISKPTSRLPSSPEPAIIIPEAKSEDVIPADLVDNNDGHPELDTLRNALTTSLSSPGGVELDENPWHKDKSSAELPPEDKA